MSKDVTKKMTRTEMRILLNARRGIVDLSLKSMTNDELWQLVLEREAKVAAMLEQVEFDTSKLH